MTKKNSSGQSFRRQDRFYSDSGVKQAHLRAETKVTEGFQGRAKREQRGAMTKQKSAEGGKWRITGKGLAVWVGTMHIVWSPGCVFLSKDSTWGLRAPLETWSSAGGSQVTVWSHLLAQCGRVLCAVGESTVTGARRAGSRPPPGG